MSGRGGTPDKQGTFLKQSKPAAAPISKPLPYEAKTSSAAAAANKQTAEPKAAAGASPKPAGPGALANALRTPSKLRPILLTGLVAGITATGVWYGATLKIEEQVNEEKRKLKTSEPDERIMHLEQARKKLVTAKEELGKKIEELQARQQAQQESTDPGS